MNSKNIPIIRLNEKSLRRLKDKIEKMKLQDQHKKDSETDTKKEGARAPKFAVYKPGVSRLSNRSVKSDQNAGDNFSSELRGHQIQNNSPVKTFHRKEKASSPSKVKGDKLNTSGWTKSSQRTHQKNANMSSSSKIGYGQNKSYESSDHRRVRDISDIRSNQKQSSGDSDYSDEEGFLARHNRRKRQRHPSLGSSQSYSDFESENEKVDSEDEFIWDDYHGDFLDGWHGNERFATPDEITIPGEEERNKTSQCNKRTDEYLEKDAIRQNTTSQPKSAGDHVGKFSEEKPSRGLLIKKPSPVEPEQPKMTRKHLFNPANPDIPIVVKPTHRSKTLAKEKSKILEMEHLNTQEHRQQSTSPAQHRSLHPSPGTGHSIAHSDQSRYGPYPAAIPTNYTSHPNHWGAPSGIDYHEEYDRSKTLKDHDDLIVPSVPENVHSHEKLLSEAETLESTVSALLSSTSEFSVKIFNEKLQFSRTKLKQVYKTLILNYIEIATKQNIEQLLWKSVYHQLMEQLRSKIASTSGDEKNDLKNVLIVILDQHLLSLPYGRLWFSTEKRQVLLMLEGELFLKQATEFYENLLMRLQQTYKINLKELLANAMSSAGAHKRMGKRTKLAIMSCQRSLICLGDISRYKENTNETSNFGRARHYYMQARSLEPRNGRPYNQLALLAVHTRRKLDAIYFYARSLATTGNPILTARESLIALFDDARRKIQHLKSKEKPATERSKSPTSDRRRASTQPKVVWLLPGQTVSDNEVADLNTKLPSFNATKEVTTSTMSPSEMLKRFVLIFTHIHGKLFTRVGLDSFDSFQNELLVLFDTILGCKTTVINKQTLLHVFAINFFTVFDQNQRSKNDTSGSQLPSRALQFVFSMISILARHVTALLLQLPLNVGQVYDPSYIAQLSMLLPSLKICHDWLYSNKDLWYPSPPPRPEKNRRYDLWESLAELSDWLIGEYKQFPMAIHSQNRHDREEVTLSEDFEFSGFAPLASVECEPRYVLIAEHTSPEQHSKAADCVRLDLLRDFLEYLCGLEEPLLAFKQGRYVVLVESVTPSEDPRSRLSSAGEDMNADLVYEKKVDPQDEYIDDSKHDEDFNQLRALRDSLQQTKHVHDKRKDHIMASLEAKGVGETTVIVRPQCLIPDTNCFIDHLDFIQALLKAGSFAICVPLVVLSELQGLAQDSKGSDEHAVKVYTSAWKAVQFLQEKFTYGRNARLQALTNQGSILHTISFQSQSDTGSKATNDDLILQCCVKYEEKNNPKHPKTYLTVLLSDDRNLRVKALAVNMPTKSIPDFCKWAGIARV